MVDRRKGADADAAGPTDATPRARAYQHKNSPDAKPVWRIQESPIIDHVTDDGEALTRLPYPFLVDAKARIQYQDFWQGRMFQVIGFQADLAQHTIDLRWRDFMKEPEAAQGMYMVTSDDKGNWAVNISAVDEARFFGFKTTPDAEGTM